MTGSQDANVSAAQPSEHTPFARPWFEMTRWLVDSDRHTFVTTEGLWTGRELFRRAAGARRLLDELRLPVGRAVVGLFDNTPTAVAIAMGAAATGRPLAPLNPRLTLHELALVTDPLRPSAVVAAVEHATVAEELARAAKCELVIVDELEPGEWTEPPRLPTDTPFYILHTSGTTGRPKPVSATESIVARAATKLSVVMELDRSAIFSTPALFNHIAGIGMFFVSVGAGAAVAPVAKFQPKTWTEVLDLGVTHVALVPTMIEKLVTAGQFKPGNLRVVQYGAAPMPLELLREAMRLLPDVGFLSTYAQTEGMPITALTVEDHIRAVAGRPELLRTVGRSCEGIELRLVDVDDSGVGEVHAHGPGLWQGDEDGWLHTGDLGRLSEDGYLTLVGRKGDLIIRGGENVYPAEVEEVLASHPSVREVAVVGQPDRVYGQAISAHLVLAQGAQRPTDEEFAAFVRTRMASFKVPAEWHVEAELPRNPNGKVLRHVLGAARAPSQGS